jgi:2,5-diketo-D-gluconate reductase A
VEEFVASSEGTVTADDVVIVTKIHPRSYSYEEMDRKLAESKELFKRDKLDVVLLHAPWCWPGHCTPEEESVGWETGWRNLVALQHKHRITSIGVSNFHAELLNKLIHEMHGQVDVVQNWMDPFHQDGEVRDICMHQGVQYMAYSSFGTQWNRTPNPVLSNPLLIEIAEHHGVSVAQVVMSWLATEGAIAIPRTANEAHMRDNFAELMLQRRVQAECAEVSAAGGALGVHCDDGHAPRSWHLDYNELRAIRALDGTLGNPWD